MTEPSRKPIPAKAARKSAVLDSAHEGDISGALGTIRADDADTRRTWRGHLVTLLAIMGPGLIVMVGDNDAGGVATYAQAGQNYGTSLLWTLLLLVPVLIVNQEMVVRLGAVTGVGHARLIQERFGRFWGTFSVGDLFLLNFLTIVTEFIGISLSAAYFGISQYIAIPIAALMLIAITVSGNFQRWERAMFVFLLGSLFVIPLAVLSHPSFGTVAHDAVIPSIRGGVTSNAVLLIIAIVGTTVAPWQLFFQQSNIIDKRITPRWMAYERADTVIGALVVVSAAALMMMAAAHAFGGTPLDGAFSDAGGVARGLRQQVGGGAGAVFAVVLLDASVIGASAVTLATSYAFGDIFGMHHSLHRSFKDARGFYAIFSCVVLLAAGVVLIPNAPLGIITTAVQALAGVLLPSATVFLLLLCNDEEVLGPWTNAPWLNALASLIVGILLVLSLILMVTTIIPTANAGWLFVTLTTALLVVLAIAGAWAIRRGRISGPRPTMPKAEKREWRMPPLAFLERPRWSPARKAAMSAMWIYLLLAVILLAVKAVQLALGH